MLQSCLNVKVGAVEGNALCDVSPVDAGGSCHVGKADSQITDLTFRTPYQTCGA